MTGHEPTPNPSQEGNKLIAQVGIIRWITESILMELGIRLAWTKNR